MLEHMTPTAFVDTEAAAGVREAHVRGADLKTAVRREFAVRPGYLATCTVGPVMASTRSAMLADLTRGSAGDLCPVEYGAVAERTRAHYARLVGVDVARVAIGSQASVFAALVAAAVPAGREVLCAQGDFSSIVLPFVHAGVRVRHVPLARLADEITADTWLVSFSLVQSATGQVADAAAIAAAASAHGARTFCDTTQAAGWLPVDASLFDATVCHAYKWLCAPRGVAFMTVRESFAATLTPLYAGWYAGENPWASCYGGDAQLATCARRFDVSPAWQAFVGAEPAIAFFANLDRDAAHAHTTGLAAAFRRGLGLTEPARPSAIVTWADPDGTALARLAFHGITASGRAGRARVAFHVFNDDADVAAALEAVSHH